MSSKPTAKGAPRAARETSDQALAALSPTVRAAHASRLMTWMTIALMVSMVATCTSLKYAMGPKVAAIAATDSGRVLPVVTLDKPYVTEQRIVSFVEECLRRAFAHDFINYRITTNDAMRCFDSDGASSYAGAIGPLLERMRKERRVMMSTIDAVPVVARGPYLVGGRAAWDVSAEISLFFEGTRDRVPPTRYEVSALVVRVDLEESVRGVALRRVVLTPAKLK